MNKIIFIILALCLLSCKMERPRQRYIEPELVKMGKYYLRKCLKRHAYFPKECNIYNVEMIYYDDSICILRAKASGRTNDQGRRVSDIEYYFVKHGSECFDCLKENQQYLGRVPGFEGNGDIFEYGHSEEEKSYYEMLEKKKGNSLQDSIYYEVWGNIYYYGENIKYEY